LKEKEFNRKRRRVIQEGFNMGKKIKEKVLILGDNIDTDVIYPGIYLPIIEPEEMAEHALEGISPQMKEKLKDYRIIVAGSNFGCGSSREQAATSLAYSGVKAIVALSFARIFYRNAINQGIYPLIVSEKPDLEEGDEIEVDLKKGEVKWNGKSIKFEPLPDFLLEIVEAGGLLPYTRGKIAEK
jgi:3-isopropylmalate/(R)-2-methylmalate dehydratase small subunit